MLGLQKGLGRVDISADPVDLSMKKWKEKRKIVL